MTSEQPGTDPMVSLREFDLRIDALRDELRRLGQRMDSFDVQGARELTQRPLFPRTAVTGSRGGNAALASLLTALAAQGFITDSTTA